MHCNLQKISVYGLRCVYTEWLRMGFRLLSCPSQNRSLFIKQTSVIPLCVRPLIPRTLHIYFTSRIFWAWLYVCLSISFTNQSSNFDVSQASGEFIIYCPDFSKRIDGILTNNGKVLVHTNNFLRYIIDESRHFNEDDTLKYLNYISTTVILFISIHTFSAES